MDTTKRKKIILLLAIILIVIAIGIGVYFALYAHKPSSAPAPSTDLPGQALFPGEEEHPAESDEGDEGQHFPTIGQGGAWQGDAEYQKKRLTMLSAGPIVDYWIASSSALKQATSSPLLDSLVFYISAKGEVIQITDVGKEEVISTASFGTPLRAWQDKAGTRAIVEFSGRIFAIFDTKARTWQELPEGTESAAFSPDGRKIAYLHDSKGGKDIYVKDLYPAKGKNPLSLIVRMALNDMHLRWTSANTIALVPSPSYDTAASPWFLDIQKKTISPGPTLPGVGIVSSGSSYSLLISSQSKKEMAASLIGPDQKEIHSFPISTLEEKCSFALDSSDLFCAVPRYFSADSYVLPDAYLKRDLKTKDVIYRLVTAGDFDNLPVIDAPQIAVDAVELTEASNQLFFKNRFDDKLYVLDLRANER
jgi:hypothetical protein